jgi:penicillin G amidase
VPIVVEVMSKSGRMDPAAEQALAQLKRWNYVADTQAVGPVIWLRWLQHYRRAVWDDEFAARGIQQPDGSWGFSGANHREPMLEVLEFMTREVPNSQWFDDRATPQRETRDQIVRRSFASAVASLVKDFGTDLDKWRWGNINKLHINSLTDQPQLARDGGGVVGTEFTVNPGSDIGTVGGGASWRMIVDLKRLDRSVGVYPGGQSEDPASPLYDDQIPIWAKGRYLPINMIDRARLNADVKTETLVFAP